MSGEAPAEKVLGPYTIKVIDLKPAKEKARYEINVCFDTVREKRKGAKNINNTKNNSKEFLKTIAAELQEHDISVSPPQSFKFSGSHLASIICEVPKAMKPSEMYSLYEAACAQAMHLISKERTQRKEEEDETASRAQALLRVLKKHNIGGDLAHAIVTDQLKELKYT